MNKEIKTGFIPKLNLNEHPKECENLSLVGARNLKLSNDLSCLESENSIITNSVINNYLSKLYGRYIIINIIPCNTELILFVSPVDKGTSVISEGYNISIIRYNEKLNRCKKYQNYKYFGGEIKGTFTYNVNGELILAIAENNATYNIPLKTINLGLFEDDEFEINNELLALNPEIIIPKIYKYDYVDGRLYKGWYYIFIRYKINNYDYTKWYSISNKILIDTLDKQNIIKYYKKEENFKTSSVSGAYDYFSNETEFSSETIKINLINLDKKYNNYQLGLFLIDNSKNKTYITNDISIDITNYTFDLSIMNEYDLEEIIKDPYNIYNVKNIINYQNRLYISNYEELKHENNNIDNIKLQLKKDTLILNDLKQLEYIKTAEVDDYYEIESIASKINNEITDDTAEAIIIKDLDVNGVATNVDILSDIKFNEKIESRTNGIELKENDYNIEEYVSNGQLLKRKYLDLKRTYIIKSTNNNLIRINVKAISSSVPLGNEYPWVDIIFEYNVGNDTYKSVGGSYFTKDDYDNNILYFDENGINGEITSEILSYSLSNIRGDKIYFINSKESYNIRKQKTTLIPGEIYNFFIHFVDKYGQYTNGYRIDNKIKLLYNNEEYVLISLNGFIDNSSDFTMDYSNYYLLRKFEDKVFSSSGYININKDSEIIICEDTSIELDTNLFTYKITTASNYIGGEPLINFLNNKYKYLENVKNIKWGDLPDATIGSNDFFPYINTKGERLFKVPYSTIDIKTNSYNQYNIHVPIYSIEIYNVDINKDYVGCFISYEKVQNVCKISGVLTKYDLIQSYKSDSELNNYNASNSDYMRFYSSDFDLLDYVDLKYNTLRIEKVNCFKEELNLNELNASTEYIANLNIPELESDSNYIKYYGIKNYEIELGGDPTKSRDGLGTCLKMPIIKELFDDNSINFYKVSLLYIDEDIYTNNDKILIKCSDIVYLNNRNDVFNYNFNGYITYNNFLIYNNNKVYYSEGNIVNKENISYNNISKYLTYVQSPVYREFMYESKQFKNNPKNYIFTITDENNINYETESGCFVEPLNSIDLFKININNGDELNPKKLYNFKKEITHLNIFDKFIRRSNQILDESLLNSWRNFEIENYKIISENKGNITNIIGFGVYLLVHTEHSIFLFNGDNTLKTLDNEIQLSNPDIFDLGYKELISSELGYAGLQDDKAYVADIFGYIFYDNDSNRFYKFDNNQLYTIDDDILNFLNKYKPKKVRFANDKKYNRLLINIIFDDFNKENNITLSYNYLINSFISFHDYNFKYAINTKNKLYLINDEDDYNDRIYNIDYYNKETMSYNAVYNKMMENQIDIIINSEYDIIKILETITYKLYKIELNIDDDYQINGNNDYKLPYSGEKIRVYNNEIDTGWLNISIDLENGKNLFTNYDKPYWYLGNWNFSYLRNKINKEKDFDYASRLYGNYFIVSIIFGNDNNKYEFESLLYNLIKG